MYQERSRFAPVREGDELDVKIDSVGEKGDGVAKKQGFVLFVPKTKAGDEVRIRVTRVLKNVGFAEVLGHTAPAKKAEPAPEENFSEENDSETFGDEPEAEEVAERSDDNYDENADEK